MKNEQQKNQKSGQDQYSNNQQQGGNKQSPPSTANTDTSAKKNPSASSSQNSNIAVDNDGRIGKAHDQWNNGDKQNDQNKSKSSNQTSGDKTVTEPEIDAPIYDPEKTEKKIPQMNEKKNK